MFLQNVEWSDLWLSRVILYALKDYCCVVCIIVCNLKYLIFSILVMIIHNLKGCIKTRVLCLVFFSWCLSEYMDHNTHFGIKLITLCEMY